MSIFVQSVLRKTHVASIDFLDTYHLHRWCLPNASTGPDQRHGRNRSGRLFSVWSRARWWNCFDCRLAFPGGILVFRFRWRSDSAEIAKRSDARLTAMRTTVIVHYEHLRTKTASALGDRSSFHIEFHRSISLFHLWRRSNLVDEFVRNQLESNSWLIFDEVNTYAQRIRTELWIVDSVCNCSYTWIDWVLVVVWDSPVRNRSADRRKLSKRRRKVEIPSPMTYLLTSGCRPDGV